MVQLVDVDTPGADVKINSPKQRVYAAFAAEPSWAGWGDLQGDPIDKGYAVRDADLEHRPVLWALLDQGTHWYASQGTRICP